MISHSKFHPKEVTCCILVSHIRSVILNFYISIYIYIYMSIDSVLKFNLRVHPTGSF